ncbi:MAG TPA: hypothetical protein VED17_04420, partial [Nitrososphaerales archaeon]|nr:hypothetical protein [Nitrososphaerales archaeon]
QYQYAAISRLIPIPQNLIAVIAFPVSFFAFIGWEYLRTLNKDRRKSAVKNETATEMRISQPSKWNDFRRDISEILY